MGGAVVYFFWTFIPIVCICIKNRKGDREVFNLLEGITEKLVNFFFIPLGFNFTLFKNISLLSFFPFPLLFPAFFVLLD